jgi:hypothetical protein
MAKTKTDWLIPAALIVLAAIPIGAGAFRLTTLAEVARSLPPTPGSSPHRWRSFCTSSARRSSRSSGPSSSIPVSSNGLAFGEVVAAGKVGIGLRERRHDHIRLRRAGVRAWRLRIRSVRAWLGS